MDYMQAITERHSVRSYIDKPIEIEKIEELQNLIEECNQISGLHMQLILNEPKAFSGIKAHYGKFSGVTNYIAIVGKKGAEEKAGYYGEQVVLHAQQLGLNTCWVFGTFSKIKEAYEVKPNEKLLIVIAIGYGKNKGTQHKSKKRDDVTKASGDTPLWFWKGVDAALLAPTAINQQRFRFYMTDGNVTAKAGMGFCTGFDLGIAKYHFEIGAGRKIFEI